jgi:hypothetical protein
MNTSENTLIFESYTASLLNEQEEALTSKLPQIIRTLESEILPDPELFYNRARTLISKIPGTTNASKEKILKNLFNAKVDGIEGMKKYLRTSAHFYKAGGFVDPKSAKTDQIKYHDQGWNKPPTDEIKNMHFGDIVKYIGPAHNELNPNDYYMIMRKFVKPDGRIIFSVKTYDWQSNKIYDEREFPKDILNPNFLKYIGNNLGRGNEEQEKRQREIAQDIKMKKARERESYIGKSKEDIHAQTRAWRPQ